MELLQRTQRGGHTVQMVQAQIHGADVLELVELHRQPIGGQLVVADIEVEQSGHLANGLRELVDVVAVQVQPPQILEPGDGIGYLPDHVPAKVELIYIIESENTLGEGSNSHLAQVQAFSPVKCDFDTVLGHTEGDLLALEAFSPLGHVLQ